jgi:hypothetical protein
MFNKYLPTNENLQAVFGSNNPICMTGPALQAYAMEHDMNPFALCEHFRIASDEEIARWGVRGCAMSPASFEMLWIAAVESVSEHVFINDTAMNMIWGDIGCEDFVPAKRIEFLKGLWQAAHMTLEEFRAVSGLSMMALCMKMGITRDNWIAWENEPLSMPECARIMLARALHILPGMPDREGQIALNPCAFRHLWMNAADCGNKEHFASDFGLCPVWPVTEEEEDEDSPFVQVPMERMEYLMKLWEIAHEGMDFFCAAAGMGIWDLCRVMGFDRQSVLSWQKDSRTIPEYVRVMLARNIGMI